MSKIDIDKFVEHLVKLGALDCNAVQSALFAQGLIFCNYKIQKIGENSPDPQFGKPIEQNPAEWSKEDESIALGIEQIANCASLLNIAPDKLDKVRNWLKSIKDRIIPQPKQEWSKEDEKIRQNLMSLLSDMRGHRIEESTYQKYYPWLKSLKDRYTWKPSDKQIRALEYIIDNVHNTSYSCKIVKELLEQLKKLKGE